MVNRVVPIVHNESLEAKLLVGAVRNELRKEFQAGPSKVTADNFLEFGDHWRRIVFHLGVMARKRGLDPDGRVQPGMFTMTLLDEHRKLIADCQGNGRHHLYLLNEGSGIHFVPLFQMHDCT